MKRFSVKYREYMQSDEWRRKRRRLIELTGNTCKRCGVDGTDEAPLDAHHLTYKRLGRELASDVVLLCRSCHDTKHESPNAYRLMKRHDYVYGRGD